MNKPFKFRYTNELVGGFVLLVLLVLLVAIFVAGQAQDWFEPEYQVRARLPTEGTFGLRKGAEVSVLQTVVGTVDRIDVNDDGRIEAVMKIRGDFTRFVRSDSVAIVKKKFAVAGDAYIEINRGIGDALPKKDATIECRIDTDLIEQIQTFLDELRDGTLRAMTSLDELLKEHHDLAVELRSPDGDLQKMLGNMNQIIAGLEAGQGTAGKLLKDPAVANQTEDLLKQLNQAVGDINSVIGKFQEAAAQLPDLTDTLGKKLEELPGVLLRAQITLLETEKLIKAFQKHWLIRGYMENPDAGGRISPGDIGTGEAGP